MKFKIGEKVIAYVSDIGLVNYIGQSRFVAKIITKRNFGIYKVELLGTESQDSEGHCIRQSVHEKAIRRIKK